MQYCVLMVQIDKFICRTTQGIYKLRKGNNLDHGLRLNQFVSAHPYVYLIYSHSMYQVNIICDMEKDHNNQQYEKQNATGHFLLSNVVVEVRKLER